jgi:hypothetical protein
MAKETSFIDLYDDIFGFQLNRINQLKAKGMNNTGYNGRYFNISISEQNEFNIAMPLLKKNFESFLEFILLKYGNNAKTLKYDSENIYLDITQITQNFNSKTYFSDRNSNYNAWVDFMPCINDIMLNKINDPFYKIWMTFIEYKNNPLYHQSNYYMNFTSPYIRLKFFQFTGSNVQEVVVRNCSGNNAMIFYLPVKTTTWLSQINSQLELFFPENDYAADNDIFRLPIFINTTGFVSTDTVDKRIKKYHRLYNITGSYYDNTNK